MSKENKVETVNIADYVVSKDGKTKYLKLQCSPKADAKTKKLVEDLKALLGSDVLYVNLFSPEFKTQYNIPDFAKGRVSVPVKDSNNSKPASQSNASKGGGVDF